MENQEQNINENTNENNKIVTGLTNLQEDQTIKKEKIIRLKNIRYTNERQAILTKILTLIGINETNKMFYSHLIDESEDIKSQVLDMVNEIKKYFKTSTWSALKPNATVERAYLSIIKSVMREMGVNFTSASLKMRYKDHNINTTLYTINN